MILSEQNIYTPANGGNLIMDDDDREILIGPLIESVSKLTGQRCTPAMIYNYEKKGLLPIRPRTDGNVRLFRVQDIHTVVCIKKMQSRGMSLELIKEKLPGCENELDLDIEDLGLPVNRRTQILEAAAVVFPRKGYASATLNDIAQEAGINYSAIYQHFKNKEEIFLALAERISFFPVMDEIIASLDVEKDTTIAEIRCSLIKVGEAFAVNHHKNTEIMRMYFSETRDFPEIGQKYTAKVIVPTEDLLARYLNAQVQRGIIRPIDGKLAAHAFFGMFSHFHIVEDILASDAVIDLPKANRASQVVDFFLSGIVNPDHK